MEQTSSIQDVRNKIEGFLTSMERYNLHNIPIFEYYVKLQGQENGYDNEANLALLKLYQFYPDRFDANYVALILLKAVTHLPHTDFALCKYLIDQQQMEGDPIASVISLGNTLERCEFQEFWSTLGSKKELVSNIKGFEVSARKFISHVVSITYQKVSKSLLADILHLPLKSDLLSEWIVKQGWVELSGDESDLVHIQNHEEKIKSRNIKERVNFDELTGFADFIQA